MNVADAASVRPTLWQFVSQFATTDIEQLASKILTELINHLREKFGDTLCDDEIVRICRTITNDRVVDEVRFAERRKRMIPTQDHALLDLEVFMIRDDSLRPDLQVEQDDFIEVLKTLLDSTHRELVELKVKMAVEKSS